MSHADAELGITIMRCREVEQGEDGIGQGRTLCFMVPIHAHAISSVYASNENNQFG